MRKRVISVLTILFTLFIASVAQAQTVVAGESTQGETLLGRSIISGYYAIYSNDNGTTYKAEETPGQPTPVTLGQAKTVQQSFGTPIDLKNVQLTHIDIKGPAEVTDGFFKANGINHIWNSNITNYDLFKFHYTYPTPKGLALSGTGDLATGKVNIKWNFTLNNIPPAISNVAQDITANSGLGDFYVDTWSKTPFAKASKAWLWTLPVVVEWYGTQKTPPPPGGTNNPPDSNLPNNLSVKVTNAPTEVYSGDPIAVTAEVKNTLKQYVITDYRWKVNGNVVKDYNNFDVISSQQNTYTMTAPEVSKPTTITFTTEVNYNHSKPPTESTWEDNIATCTVTVLPHPEAESGDLDMWIEAPASVSNSPLPKPWALTVWVKPPSIPAPPPPPPDSDSEPPPPPKLSISVTTTGGLRGDHYEYSTGQQDIEPIEPTYSGRKTVPYEDTSPIPFTFTFPWSGVWGQGTQVHIKATGSLTSWCGSWSGQAQKDVKIGEVPIPGKKPILTH